MSSFSHTIQSPESRGRSSGASGRPSFCSRNTSDRLQESLREGGRSPSMPASNIKPLRRSAFKEIGLDDLNTSIHNEYDPAHNDSMPMPISSLQEEKPRAKGITFDDILKDIDTQELKESKKMGNPLLSKMARGSRPMIKTTASAPPSTFPTLSRIALIACLIAIVLPSFLGGKDNANIGAADAGVIPNAELVDNASSIQGRANSPTSVCTRWSHQTAVVNGTLYIYGGQATTSSSQTSNTWNNNFLTMDLTKTWQISSPSLTGLPQPSGPPAVSNGYLWHSLEALFLYGGEFSDSPSTSPVPMAMWEYDIRSASWTEYSSPQTSAGNNSDGGGQPVQRAAEGAGLTIPELGKSYYFGGHLDLYTTEGWSNQIARVYLKSLLEFTLPGYTNTGVSSLGSTTGAGSGGVYRNITQGGLQADAGFTERADGVLVYVPGWGVDGIMLGLAGGTNETFTEMNVIDIYDIATSTWYKQSTSGTSPPIRVDPCAVVAAAPDGSSFNVYLYGGQNLIPYGSQIQYSDMWILTIPSFTWIQVDMDGQSEPPARAGHTCNLYDSQMVVVGGYVGKDISCDSPGIYVFNASSLQWVNSYTPLSNPSSSTTGSSGSSSSSSSGTYGGSDILQGSIGYQVPDIVQSIIGGSSLGGASATTPAAGSATTGPFATGRPPTFTVTESGQTVSATATATSKTTSTATSNPQTTSKKSGPNVGAIVAGTIAGALALLAGYLAFCSWLYRKQLRLYKNHVAMAQRTAFAQSPENQWNPSDESGTSRVNEKVAGAAGGTVLGAFGTAIAGRGSGSTGRPSYGGGNSGPSAGTTSGNDSGGETVEGENRVGSYGGYGGGVMPGGGTAGIGYGRLSEEDETEYHGAGNMAYGHTNWGRPRPLGSTTNSSVEDLLGGQEPSFFSVVLNPRRTLKVVNHD